MIDTHCHIYLDQFDRDREAVLNRAADVGITDICMPAIDFGSIEAMERMAHATIRFHKMAGIHPTEVTEQSLINLEPELSELSHSGKMVAVGETGLDYYWSTDWVDQQKESLRIHCKVAKDAHLPIILHNRESTDDMLQIIEEEQNGSLAGIWHCFNGTEEEGRRALDLGLHLGIGGVATFKNAGVDATVKKLDLDRMVLETDAPYLAPTPKRGNRNEPAFMDYTAKKLATLFDMTLEEIDEKTTATARHLFGLEG